MEFHFALLACRITENLTIETDESPELYGFLIDLLHKSAYSAVFYNLSSDSPN